MVQVELDFNFLNELIEHVGDRLLLYFLKRTDKTSFLMDCHVNLAKSPLTFACSNQKIIQLWLLGFLFIASTLNEMRRRQSILDLRGSIAIDIITVNKLLILVASQGLVQVFHHRRCARGLILDFIVRVGVGVVHVLVLVGAERGGLIVSFYFLVKRNIFRAFRIVVLLFLCFVSRLHPEFRIGFLSIGTATGRNLLLNVRLISLARNIHRIVLVIILQISARLRIPFHPFHGWLHYHNRHGLLIEVMILWIFCGFPSRFGLDSFLWQVYVILGIRGGLGFVEEGTAPLLAGFPHTLVHGDLDIGIRPTIM